MPHSCRHLAAILLLAVGWPGALAAAVESGTVITRQDVQEGYIAVTGGKVWYRIIGADKPGIPLLALHGGPGDTSGGFTYLESLADERPVVYYDQLGCGLSDRPADATFYNVEHFVEELGQVRTALGLKRVHLYGHSWGSMLATDYMLTQPAGIVSLTLGGPCLSASRWVADQRAYLAEMPGDALGIVLRNEAAGTFDDKEYRRVEKDFLKLHVYGGPYRSDWISRGLHGDAVYSFMWGPSEFSATGTLKSYERVERLHEIHVPTLFVCGQYDEATPAATALYQSKIAGAQLKVLPNTGHAGLVEKPEVYCAVLREFLHAHDMPSGKD